MCGNNKALSVCAASRAQPAFPNTFYNIVSDAKYHVEGHLRHAGCVEYRCHIRSLRKDFCTRPQCSAPRGRSHVNN
ncbi:hypothetical protein J6590_064889 [Homalodisca vitripennis]|nr:hypothetical protein J6590_064889 [Homalodisca vitripennis]